MHIQISKPKVEIANLFSDVPEDSFLVVNRTKPRRRTGGCGPMKHWDDRCIYPHGSGWSVRVRFKKKLYNLGWTQDRREAKKIRNRFWREK